MKDERTKSGDAIRKLIEDLGKAEMKAIQDKARQYLENFPQGMMFPVVLKVENGFKNLESTPSNEPNPWAEMVDNYCNCGGPEGHVPNGLNCRKA